MKTTLEKLQESLPALEQKMKAIAGVEISLFIVPNEEERSYRIKSEDLSAKLTGICVPMFKEIAVDFWGGAEQSDDAVNYIYFYPKMTYSFYSGGSNGTDYIWQFLIFDKSTGEWDFDNSNLIYKK